MNNIEININRQRLTEVPLVIYFKSTENYIESQNELPIDKRNYDSIELEISFVKDASILEEVNIRNLSKYIDEKISGFETKYSQVIVYSEYYSSLVARQFAEYSSFVTDVISYCPKFNFNNGLRTVENMDKDINNKFIQVGNNIDVVHANEEQNYRLKLHGKNERIIYCETTNLYSSEIIKYVNHSCNFIVISKREFTKWRILPPSKKVANFFSNNLNVSDVNLDPLDIIRTTKLYYNNKLAATTQQKINSNFKLIDNNSNKLMIIFQSAGRVPDELFCQNLSYSDLDKYHNRLNYGKLASDKMYNYLYVKDNYNYAYGYYITDQGMIIIEALKNAINEIIAPYDEVYTFGTSKGGAAAIIYGNLINKCNHIIAGVPIIDQFDYIKNNQPVLLDEVASGKIAENLLKTQVSDTLKNGKVNTLIISGKSDIDYAHLSEDKIGSKVKVLLADDTLKHTPIVLENIDFMYACLYVKDKEKLSAFEQYGYIKNQEQPIREN